MFKKIGILAILMLCFTLNMEAQKSSKDAQRKAKLKEQEAARKAAKKAAKNKGTKKITSKDRRDRDDNSDVRWTDRLVGGGSLGGGYANGWNVNVTPWIGYKVTDRFWTGVGLDYYYSSFRDDRSDLKTTYSVLGPKVFATYYILQEINLATEFSRNTFNFTQSINGTKFKDSDSNNSWLVGAGYTQRFGNKGGVRLELFYDVLYDETNDYNFRRNAFVPRINFVYGL